MIKLSPEDSLRLNVLLANQPLAIRIDESKMKLLALAEQGEMEIQLNPTGRDEAYIKAIKEQLSLHVLGTPSGYPIHLRRWIQMGQGRHENLAQLLLLAEPEAVLAVVYSPYLNDELARLAWWAMEEAENARQMLRCPAVVQGQMGPVLAQYLFEFLPFETESSAMIASAQLILQSTLLNPDQVDQLWRRAKRKNGLYLGFLTSRADRLPENSPAHPAYAHLDADAADLKKILSPQGQAWLRTLKKVLARPNDQDVVNITLSIVADYFRPFRAQPIDASLDELKKEAQYWAESKPEPLRSIWMAARILSGSGYGIVRPIFSKSDAIGTLMRKKLQPIWQEYIGYIDRLLG